MSWKIAYRLREFSYPVTTGSLYVAEPFLKNIYITATQRRRLYRRDKMGERIQINSDYLTT
ncbi:MAG: hypothetical protein ACR2JB_07590 [Bryobacteraceae bacterium]